MLLIYSSLVNIWAVSTFSAIVNNAAMNIGVQVSVWVPVLNSFGYMYLEEEKNRTFKPLFLPVTLSTDALFFGYPEKV